MDLLDPLDAAMMTGEVIASPLHVAAVLILKPPDGAGPGYVDDLYRQARTTSVAADRRLRRYPHLGVDTGGLWSWREADAVDLDRHLTRRTLPAGSGRNELWQLVSRLHAERLDRSGPMWAFCLIDGLDDGRFAWYLKVHHTIMDGVAGLQMIIDSLSADPDRREMPPFHAASAGRAGISKPGGLPNPFAVLRSVLGAATSGVELSGRLVGGLSDLVHNLTDDAAVAPLTAPYTRLNDEVGHDRVVAAVTVSKARIRAVQALADVTGNDVLTAVVAGVLRGWLLDHGELPDRSLVAFCPITVRAREPENQDGGNAFGGWLCPLGTDLDDPAARLHLIHRSMTQGKGQVANRGGGVSMLLLSLGIAPTLMTPAMPRVSRLRTGYNLPISNVPGPHREMYWNGAHVEDIYPISTVYSGQALNVTVCSYADRACFGWVAGADAMPDIDTVTERTERSLAELEAAVGVSPATRRG
ncbi:wax ester/triacylglycerol synthase family O-acyltransferase [Mycolicibacterium sp. ND9-15]|uniref:wax ester/triacylglycerol synthase family O-acyltransferase n=1 Tax=Mycolicibacterium sp. ND9-15 TaxID=3042320 RepID=UPI002DDBA7FE|nr:wax ester/triacylglycerol synthase family O-acyltransferase [Mycolicibacterium sp. ND9-15]WSE55128.1 wax ester/triacylglycerol synthase family O-acyltransferase [Mycolicibacterium sp. ND9-15]